MIQAWQPSATLSVLQARADFYAHIRDFFAHRQVLEVETPLLVRETATDPHIGSFTLQSLPGEPAYLHTSPEFAMKRLLAAGVGSIYQICKVFRVGEIGYWHQPEFTMLEWYRTGMTHLQLMDEVEELVQSILPCSAFKRCCYADVFHQYTGLNSASVSVTELQQVARAHQIGLPDLSAADRAGWMDLVFSHLVVPHLGHARPEFLFDFPMEQAALARIRPQDPPVAERFELFMQGLEIANGFHELKDASEQRARFEMDLATRKGMGVAMPPCPESLLSALQAGLPDCAGVAVGLDRLLMRKLGLSDLSQTLTFSFSQI